MPVLTGIDLLGIQSYVFASNRLRDVLSASWMVERVTSRTSLAQWGLTDERVLLAAGGNAVLEFDTLDDARKWTAFYSRWVHETAPGLDAAIVHQPYDGRPMAWGLKALQIALARRKLERLPSAAQLGLSVTAACSVTGLPATDLDQGALVSRRVRRLREQIDQARGRWDEFRPGELKHAPRRRADFPDELDRMGRTRGETSLIGVVHVDGNGVGRAISAWLQRCVEVELDDRLVREHCHEWSNAISALGRKVLRVVVNRIAECVHTETDEDGNERRCLRGTPHDLGFALHDRTDGGTFLPLRPILLGGDDLTFICDGRIGLDLAATGLREFRKHKIPHLDEGGGEKTLTACAGVALVKAHAPFHRSYELAEGLCESAKRFRLKYNQQNEVEAGCWLDWHAGMTRPGESVEAIRVRQYRHGASVLTMRPYPLLKSGGHDRSWDWLDRELLGPGRTSESAESGFRGAANWAGSRSRVKYLGSLVTSDRGEVKRQIEAWKITESGLQLPAGIPDDGFIGAATPLLDAIELMDLHLRLKPDPREVDKEVASATYGAAGADAKQAG